MQKHTKEKQLNNEGFSLVELLIAIVILAIIVIPLLHTFVTSARTSAKARNTMHATAIAEDVMEDFEAYSIEEMAKQYLDAGNTAQEDENGKWTFIKQDDKTTSGTYDVVVELDPTVTQYVGVNEKKQVDIQNLAGSLNAVYTEAEDASSEAYQFFLRHSGKYSESMTDEQIVQLAATLAENVTKTIEINIDSSRVKLDLGSAGELETDVYLVTARSQYHCNTSLLEGSDYGDYPQTGNDAIIFSNEESVRKRAEELKAKADSGDVVTNEDRKLSQLANIIICMQPRYEAATTPGTIVDTVIVNNPDNVQTNVFLVKQELSTSRENEMQESFSNWNTRKSNYGAEYILKESHPDWITSYGTAACRLRTNLLPDSHIKYTFSNLAISGSSKSGVAYRNEDGTDYLPANSDGAKALTIMSADTLTPKVQKNHIYEIRVKVYEQGMKDSGNPLITMDGTVVQ